VPDFRFLKLKTMKYYFSVLLLYMLPFVVLAQVWDDFYDGNFTQNPTWVGDGDEFVVNDDFRLQLFTEGEGVSALSTAFDMLPETEWRFWIKLSFSPSANNNARYYLASDETDLKSPLNGYYLQFGEGGTEDAIELFRQEGQNFYSVCRGADGLIATPFEFWVRVRKDQAGTWKIEVDQTGNGAYLLDATGVDNTFSVDGSLGVFCKYTASNSTKFYFDDIYAGQFDIDTQPPSLENLVVISDRTLDVYFSEAVTPASAENVQNYFVNNNIENPYSAFLDDENTALAHLTFDRVFQNGVVNTITITNISDIAGNVAASLTGDFSFFTPGEFEIQFNEIMADPNPTIGLPDFEYLELINTTFLNISLKDWKLMIGTTEKVFEDVTINANGYLILADEDAFDYFSGYGPFYGFSSFALTNAGQTVVLKNPENAVIHSVHYTDTWYNDPNKEEGGWSIEQIDPENPCGGSNNWSASVDPSGGTPGRENSIFGYNPDETAPELAYLIILDNQTIEVVFSEPMDSTLLFNKEAYEIDRNIGTPQSVEPVAPDYQSVILGLGSPIEGRTIYLISIRDDLTDCAGNIIDRSKTLDFGLPEMVEPGDIVINEILYNPKDDFVTGVDYVEIYNLSEKLIDLSQLALATEDDKTGELESVKDISEKGILFFPGRYLVLSINTDVVQQQYYTSDPDGFIQMASLPSYSNESGIVVLTTKWLELIDRVAYNDEMQLPILNTSDGVSLERVNFNRPSDDPTNWHSAAEDVGYGTPGYRNSVFSESVFVDDPFTIDPEIFSPDNDGYDDLLNINYRFELPGQIASAYIFDSRGRQVRYLLNNEILGTEGTFSWDGITDDRQKAGIGIYIIYIEVSDLNGNLSKYKKTAVLGSKF